MIIRAPRPEDFPKWRPLYDGYNAFYGRDGGRAPSESHVRAVWNRFFDPAEPIDALVAEQDGQLLGMAHLLMHRNVRHLEDSCYLQDLFTAPQARGKGVARALIEQIYALAANAGCSHVYWTTHYTNTPARALYDRVAENRGFIVYTHDLT
jgi:GNAT superfamily N-acetyltransferase